VGEDNVLWGTDSIWYGSPQDQIQAFRAFEIPADMRDRYGYPELTDAVKAKVLWRNAARLHGIDPAKVPCRLPDDATESLRRSLPPAQRTYGPRTAAAARALFAAEHPWA
jgi:uncharacterized protein